MTRINTNVQSLIARRALDMNNRSLTQSLERLSSGLRINSGRDDPAGLIASETLRSSVRAITSAVDNAIRADTIVAVAEGGLQEINSLLLELEALVDHSANEGGLTAEEVSANQLQIDAILQSINRLADSSAFGDKKLLDGTLDFVTSGVNINESTGGTLDHLDKVQVNSAKLAAGSFRQVTINVTSGSQFAYVSAQGAAGTFGTGASVSAVTIQIRGNYGSELLSFASGTTAASVRDAVNASTALTGVSAVLSGAGTTASPTSIMFTSNSYGSEAFVSVSIIEKPSTTSDGLTLSTGQDYGANGSVTVNGANAIVSGLDVSVRTASLSADLTLSTSFGSTDGGSTSFEITGGGANFSISPTVGLAGMESVGIGDVSTSNLGSNAVGGFLASLGSGLTNDLASRNFAVAQRIVRAAINEVASLRGRLGAFQKDTLQTTINSLQVARENVTAAESAIRDADFAAETAALTRAQILVNASSTVLQIANAQPSNVLALLG
ncbi:MAG: flagellin [Phycisphaerae bacterium]